MPDNYDCYDIRPLFSSSPRWAVHDRLISVYTVNILETWSAKRRCFFGLRRRMGVNGRPTCVGKSLGGVVRVSSRLRGVIDLDFHLFWAPTLISLAARS